MCCVHGSPSQSDLSSLNKGQLEAGLFNSSCVQPALFSASLHQSQQLQRCWDPDNSSQCLPPSSPVMGPIKLNCSRGYTSQPQAAASQPQSQTKSYLHRQHHREVLPESQAQPSAERSRPGQRQSKLSTSTALLQQVSHTAVDRDVMTEENWEERCRVGEARGQIAAVEKGALLNEELQQDRREPSPAQKQQQLHVPHAAELREELQRNRSALMLRDHRDIRVRYYAYNNPRGIVYTAICKRKKQRSLQFDCLKRLFVYSSTSATVRWQRGMRLDFVHLSFRFFISRGSAKFLWLQTKPLFIHTSQSPQCISQSGPFPIKHTCSNTHSDKHKEQTTKATKPNY